MTDTDEVRKLAERLYAQNIERLAPTGEFSPAEQETLRSLAVSCLRAARIFVRLMRESYLVEPGEWE